MSGFFSVLGILTTVFTLRYLKNPNLAKGVFYFVLMETLQFVQYIYIADDVDPVAPTAKALMASPKCQAAENQFLTFLGFLHICFQPIFAHYVAMGSGLMVNSERNLGQSFVIKRLCIVGGLWMLARGLLGIYPDFFASIGLDNVFGNADYLAAGGDNGHLPREWISGGTLCTYMGKFHLAWSVPLISPSYYVPSMNLHQFLMFIPFLVMDSGSKMANVYQYLCGAGLFFSGPILGDYITGNKHEAASIWCFFSILQCVSGVVCNTVIMLKGRQWGLPVPGDEVKDAKGRDFSPDAKSKPKTT